MSWPCVRWSVGVAPRAVRRAASWAAWGERTWTLFRPWACDDGLDGVVGEEAALADHDEMLGGQGHLAHQMRRHQHGASLGGEGAQQGTDPQDAVGVEPVDGLIENQDGGVAEQGGGDPEALSHPEGEPARPSGGDAGEADEIEDLLGATRVDPVGEGQAAEVVEGAAAGVEGLGVEERADLEERLVVAGEGPSVDERRTRRGIVEAEDHAQRGGLTGAVGAEEAGDPPGMDLEAEVVHGDGLAVPLRQAAHLDARRLGSHFVFLSG